jgi:hypothetical protein
MAFLARTVVPALSLLASIQLSSAFPRGIVNGVEIPLSDGTSAN